MYGLENDVMLGPTLFLQSQSSSAALSVEPYLPKILSSAFPPNRGMAWPRLFEEVKESLLFSEFETPRDTPDGKETKEAQAEGSALYEHDFFPLTGQGESQAPSLSEGKGPETPETVGELLDVAGLQSCTGVSVSFSCFW